MKEQNDKAAGDACPDNSPQKDVTGFRSHTAPRGESLTSPLAGAAEAEGKAEARARLDSVFGPDPAGAAIAAGRITPVPDPEAAKSKPVTEKGGPSGPEPTRYGDWERKGRCVDF